MARPDSAFTLAIFLVELRHQVVPLHEVCHSPQLGKGIRAASVGVSRRYAGVQLFTLPYLLNSGIKLFRGYRAVLPRRVYEICELATSVCLKECWFWDAPSIHISSALVGCQGMFDLARHRNSKQ